MTTDHIAAQELPARPIAYSPLCFGAEFRVIPAPSFTIYADKLESLLREAQARVRALAECIALKPNEKCFMCGKEANQLAGDPGEWPVRLGYTGGNGKTRVYHRQCISEALAAKDKADSAIAEWESREAAVTSEGQTFEEVIAQAEENGIRRAAEMLLAKAENMRQATWKADMTGNHRIAERCSDTRMAFIDASQAILALLPQGKEASK
jgi:hypothetical protein